jgi:hypothetical protein
MPSAIDEQHSVWRTKLVDLASKSRVELSHGQAAKLINIYLKSIFVCGGFHEHTHVKSLHPPIDRILLQEMLAKGFGDTSNWKKVNWTKLTSDEYQK